MLRFSLFPSVFLSCSSLLWSIGLVLGTLCLPEISDAQTAPTRENYLRLADEVNANLNRHIVGKWFPAAVAKEYGGFHQNFQEDWSLARDTERSVVYQSRLIWMASQMIARNAAQAEAYRTAARHGFDYLSETMQDQEQGGFFWAVNMQGKPMTARKDEKHVYGISFALYASCAYYRATQDQRALDLSKQTFRWLEEHAHDAKNGGYYEALSRAGNPILTPTDKAVPSDAIGTHYGYKSMNSHIHLLEAFTALYSVWRDPAVKRRLEELFLIVRDKIAVAPGCLNLYFTPDWKPIPELDSFGHDIETAYLLTEAAEVLGKPNDAKAWRVARSLVDHALDYGWDAESGGFYDAGTTFGTPSKKEKIWWVQAEGINALLWMHRRYNKETPRYWNAFVKQWEFIRTHQVDPKYGGWYPQIEPDGEPTKNRQKSDGWTECYHQGRAMLEVEAVLRGLADPALH